ncbi:MAG: DUF1294 domain-containing protein [Clostridiales bacterium]|nr:DUF1294 domain-containing protein [Clostridiales bacterium]
MKIYLIYLATLSLITFFVYAVDKAKAKRGAWRISEKILLSLGFFGGAVGALIAMQTVRHKTKHWYFYAINFLGIAWQIALLYLIYSGVIQL